MPPAARSRATAVASALGTKLARPLVPPVQITQPFPACPDRDGHAMKRTFDFAAGERRVGFIGLFPRASAVS